MIRLFASEHPEAIQGMVFVDPFTKEFVDLLGVEYLDNHPMAGKLPFDTSQPDNLSKYQRALVLPGKIKHCSLCTLLVKLVKIGAKVLRHSRYVIFQIAEVAIRKEIFTEILSRISRLRCCSQQ